MAVGKWQLSVLA